MRCKQLEAVLEQEGLGPLPVEAREHLAECSECQELFGDLAAIAGAARQLPAEVDPPDRLWISLRAQLAAEGIICEATPAELSHRVPWWQGISQFFRPRVLVSVGAGVVLVLGIYVATRPGPARVQETQAHPRVQISETLKEVTNPPVPDSPAPPLKAERPAVRPNRGGVPLPPRVSPKDKELRPSPSENAFLGETAGVLNNTENDLPGRELTRNAAADAAMRANLSTLNEFIAECEARLKQNPQDRMTREYLNAAYQQKAELLTAIMDSGRSEH